MEKLARLKHQGIHVLRHTSIKTITDTYGHMMEDDQAKTEKALEAWKKQIGC